MWFEKRLEAMQLANALSKALKFKRLITPGFNMVENIL